MLSFFPLDVSDEIWDLIESVSEGFLTCSFIFIYYFGMLKVLFASCIIFMVLLLVCLLASLRLRWLKRVRLSSPATKNGHLSQASPSLCYCFYVLQFSSVWGWSGGAMVLGKLPVPGRPTIWITVGQGPTALVVGAGGGRLDILLSSIPFSSLSPSLWETA